MRKVRCRLCGEEIDLENCKLHIDSYGWSIECPNGCSLISDKWGNCPDIEIEY